MSAHDASALGQMIVVAAEINGLCSCRGCVWYLCLLVSSSPCTPRQYCSTVTISNTVVFCGASYSKSVSCARYYATTGSLKLVVVLGEACVLFARARCVQRLENSPGFRCGDHDNLVEQVLQKNGGPNGASLHTIITTPAALLATSLDSAHNTRMDTTRSF